MNIFTFLVLLLAAIAIYLLARVLRILKAFSIAIATLTKTRGGMYSAFSFEEVEAASFARERAYQKMEEAGGYLSINNEWLRESIRAGTQVDELVRQACENAEAAFEWQRAIKYHEFLIQGNLDVLNGKSSIEEVHERRRDFTWSLTDVAALNPELREQKKNLEAWIHEESPKVGAVAGV